jgi:hypothetical protein
MVNAKSKTVSSAAMEAMNALQQFTVPNQILGIAGLMVLMYEQYGIQPIEALNVADNIIQDLGNYSDFQGIKAYMKNTWNV